MVDSFLPQKRGYVKAGPWTPEAAVENPEAVRQLHREFLRAGSNVMQAFTFYASEDKLVNRGHEAGRKFTCADINRAACKLAREVASEGDAIVGGGISQTPTYLNKSSRDACKVEFKKQIKVFQEEKLDFLICEYFEHIEEMEMAIETCRETAQSMPVCATMCIGPMGDMHGVSAGACAVRMVKAGAHVVGINCHFDPMTVLDTLQLMIDAVKAAGLKCHFIAQPLAYHTPDAGRQGFIDLPEFPFALEPRICSRWDMHAYARRAHDMGVKYIGGCCGFEPYHTRAIAEELHKEIGRLPEGSKKHDLWGEGLKMHTKPWVRARANRTYWEELKPASGRPYCPSLTKPDNWGVTQGDKILTQQAEGTTKEEIEKLRQFKK